VIAVSGDVVSDGGSSGGRGDGGFSGAIGRGAQPVSRRADKARSKANNAVNLFILKSCCQFGYCLTQALAKLLNWGNELNLFPPFPAIKRG